MVDGWIIVQKAADARNEPELAATPWLYGASGGLTARHEGENTFCADTSLDCRVFSAETR